MPLTARSSELELLDGPDLDPAELRRNLREMAMLNRLPGGVGASLRAVSGLLDGRTDAAVLDVGIGSGDFARRLARRRPGVAIVGLDLRAEVLEVARRNLADTNGVALLVGDARAIPLPDGSVDVTHASLLVHHLDPDHVVEALREMRRVARRGIVVNDLRRGRLAFAVTAATVRTLARGAYTRHDGPLSARRAYTLGELDQLAARADLQLVSRTSPAWPRVTTVYA
jgi:SAM-dependent methyltransferase